MFLFVWLLDAILTTLGVIVLAIFFGNSPITFLFFFIFPLVFITFCYWIKKCLTKITKNDIIKS